MQTASPKPTQVWEMLKITTLTYSNPKAPCIFGESSSQRRDQEKNGAIWTHLALKRCIFVRRSFFKKCLSVGTIYFLGTIKNTPCVILYIILFITNQYIYYIYYPIIILLYNIYIVYQPYNQIIGLSICLSDNHCWSVPAGPPRAIKK